MFAEEDWNKSVCFTVKILKQVSQYQLFRFIFNIVGDISSLESLLIMFSFSFRWQSSQNCDLLKKFDCSFDRMFVDIKYASSAMRLRIWQCLFFIFVTKKSRLGFSRCKILFFFTEKIFFSRWENPFYMHTYAHQTSIFLHCSWKLRLALAADD